MLRLLASHPDLDVLALAGDRRVGQEVADALPHLAATGLPAVASPAEVLASGADVLFSCLPSGALDDGAVRARLVVDLADTNRAAPGWVYGLTEFAREEIEAAPRVANPGCYPTATLLALVPFLRAGVAGGPITVDALSGLSGAGRKHEDRLSFATADGNANAYGTTEHRHVPEIERGLGVLGGRDVIVSFTPHLVPMSRGLLVTARAPLAADVTDAEALEVLRESYAGETFVYVSDKWPSTKAVVGTNSAHLSARVDARAGLLIVSAAIDNLGKGAAGQAIQNANVALGLDETSGLETCGLWP